jgi:hypothetical protein
MSFVAIVVTLLHSNPIFMIIARKRHFRFTQTQRMENVNHSVCLGADNSISLSPLPEFDDFHEKQHENSECF